MWVGTWGFESVYGGDHGHVDVAGSPRSVCLHTCIQIDPAPLPTLRAGVSVPSTSKSAMMRGLAGGILMLVARGLVHACVHKIGQRVGRGKPCA